VPNAADELRRFLYYPVEFAGILPQMILQWHAEYDIILTIIIMLVDCGVSGGRMMRDPIAERVECR